LISYIVAGSISLALGITYWALINTLYARLHDANAQNALQFNEPVVRIEPEKEARSSETGVFTLTFVNSGTCDLDQVRIWHDPCTVDSSRPPNIVRHGIFISHGDSRIPRVAAHGRVDFEVNFRNVWQDMIKEGDSMAFVLRLLLKYRRAADGVTFSKSKVYYIVAAGKILIDLDQEPPRPVGPSLADIKNALGGTAQRREPE
jgi:hypothetical protein